MSEEVKSSNNLFLQGLIVCAVISILTSFYFFYYQKDYDFLVETACDPTLEECFHRDCTNPDDCPPNGLEDFKRYSLTAEDYSQCINEDCKNACETGTVNCLQTECTPDEEFGESCISPESAQNLE